MSMLLVCAAASQSRVVEKARVKEADLQSMEVSSFQHVNRCTNVCNAQLSLRLQCSKGAIHEKFYLSCKQLMKYSDDHKLL